MAVSEEQFQVLRGEHKVIALLLVMYLTNADQSVVVIVSVYNNQVRSANHICNERK